MQYADLTATQAERIEMFDSMDPCNAAPLDQLPALDRARIAAAVAAPRPPAMWLDFGLCAFPSRAWFEWYWQRGTRPGMHRRKIPAAVRRAVIERDGSTCGICGGEVAANDLHLDHVTPYASGGLDTIDNLRVAHAGCNTQRGAPLA